MHYWGFQVGYLSLWENWWSWRVSNIFLDLSWLFCPFGQDILGLWLYMWNHRPVLWCASVISLWCCFCWCSYPEAKVLRCLSVFGVFLPWGVPRILFSVVKSLLPALCTSFCLSVFDALSCGALWWCWFLSSLVEGILYRRHPAPLLSNIPRFLIKSLLLIVDARYLPISY